MSWYDHCHDFDSRVEASATDKNFHDTTFLLTQEDAENPCGDKVSANKVILALISPTFYAQFFGPFSVSDSVKDGIPIEIVDGTARGFKQMINFISHPKSYQLNVESVDEVFDISYFAHKYQIGSLVSICRTFLGSYGVHDGSDGFRKQDALDILEWSLSNLQLSVTFPAEHALLVHACWEQIVNNFKDIFPDGEVSNEQSLLNEDLLIKILGNKFLAVDEGFLLTVALNYYRKLIERESVTTLRNGHKKIKIDQANLWNKKLAKMSTVIKFRRVSPNKFSHILEKMKNKIPQNIIVYITMKVSSGWKERNSFQDKIRSNLRYNPFTSFDLDDGNESFPVNCANKEVNVKFRINKNSIIKLDQFDDDIFEEMEYVSFQNESDYEEIIKENVYGKTFFAKENTVITLRFKKLEHVDDLYMTKMERLHYSEKGLEFNIIEVNGEPVINNTSYNSFLTNFNFLPI